MPERMRTDDVDGAHVVQNMFLSSQLWPKTTLSIANGFLQPYRRHGGCGWGD